MSGCPSASNRTSSYSACATPWARPPCCWPATSSGLRMRPQSSTATWRTRRDPPRLGVDLDHGHVRAEREGGAVLVEVQARGELLAVARDLRPRDGRRRHAAHAELAVVGERDVVDGRLQQLRRPTAGLLQHVVGRDEHGVAAHLQRPRAAGAPAARHDRGVGLDEADLVDRDAEAVAREHGERGGVALAVRGRARGDRGRAVGVHGDRAVLAAAAARRDLDVDADPDAELDRVARLAAGALLLAELVVVGDAQGLAQRQVVVADVVARAGQRA